MNNVVITISRMYGSGGKTVGQMLSKRLGIEYYDKDLMRLASEDSGINEAMFNKADEKKKGSFFGLNKNVYGGELITPESSGFTSEDNLFNYQAKIIKELAEKESCIIIGRCADYILENNPNVVSVFVHAPLEFLLKNAAEKVNLTGRELEKYIAKIDATRSEYYKYHTGREWTDARNYDLCLDSSKLGFDKCVEEILSYIKVRFPDNELVK
ncbi:MAG: cytidylate kinase-like family protein [Lachnospiraceae bacterium]|nr:cytidylate kinase-like family protein [Lachnospiraceae bacterium]